MVSVKVVCYHQRCCALRQTQASFPVLLRQSTFLTGRDRLVRLCEGAEVSFWLQILTSVFVSLYFPAGFELLYQPEVVRLYLSLLTESQNYNTLEAAAGALQNLSAGQWTVSTGLGCYRILLAFFSPSFIFLQLLSSSLTLYMSCDGSKKTKSALPPWETNTVL